MAFEPYELRVEFAGLCLYVVDPRAVEDGQPREAGRARKVTIAMPDARKTADPVHADGAKGDAHVGYIRFDLANILAAVRGPDVAPPNYMASPGDVDEGSGSPPNEVIHRFNLEELDFGLQGDTSAVDHQIKVPDFNGFTDAIIPIAAVLDSQNPQQSAPFLMRTTVNGGRIRSQPSGKTWGFSPVLKYEPNGGYSGNFAGFVVWTREMVEPQFENGIVVRIQKFDGTGVTSIPLKPVPMRGSDGKMRPRISVKVANLCADNPLEWDEFRLRNVVDRDIDFKWLYKLLESETTNLKARLSNAELPFPREVSVQAYGDEDCMGGSISFPR